MPLLPLAYSQWPSRAYERRVRPGRFLCVRFAKQLRKTRDTAVAVTVANTNSDAELYANANPEPDTFRISGPDAQRHPLTHSNNDRNVYIDAVWRW